MAKYDQIKIETFSKKEDGERKKQPDIVFHLKNIDMAILKSKSHAEKEEVYSYVMRCKCVFDSWVKDITEVTKINP